MVGWCCWIVGVVIMIDVLLCVLVLFRYFGGIVVIDDVNFEVE